MSSNRATADHLALRRKYGTDLADLQNLLWTHNVVRQHMVAKGRDTSALDCATAELIEYLVYLRKGGRTPPKKHTFTF